MKGIVTLCGSVRFKNHFDVVNRELTLASYIVLQPGIWEHKWLHDPENNAELTKDGLDRLHCDKINMSDSIVVINLGGYIGKSTSAEIDFAERSGKNIFWFEINPFLPERKSWEVLLIAK